MFYDWFAMPTLLDVRDRLIVALDVSTAQEAQRLVQQVGEAAGFYKVGLQLFTAEGPGITLTYVPPGFLQPNSSW